jgi:glyoxylase-like metal-dependent hydrolase (beta-lactamase superfamily II)
MLTHGHFVHVLGTARLASHYGDLPIYMHPDDKFTLDNNEFFCRVFGAPMPDTFRTNDVREGDVIKVGSLGFEVIETPGHTVGGVCYLERDEKILMSGDTLFAGAIGRSDHPGGDYDVLMKSIFEKLLMLDGDIRVLPGHGPSSDIATERMTNPFLMPFNEPYED